MGIKAFCDEQAYTFDFNRIQIKDKNTSIYTKTNLRLKIDDKAGV